MKLMVCSHCQSPNVRRDAYAAWNTEAQTWELATVYDAAYCTDCDGETSLEEIEIP